MWNTLSILIFTLETLLLLGFLIRKFWKKERNLTAFFLTAVFALDLALYAVPCLHGREGNLLLGLLGCVGASLKLFVGEANVSAVSEFAAEVPMFTYAYLLGWALSVLATVNAALEAFGRQIRNHFRLHRALRQPVCDIVVGNSQQALQYAKNENALLLLDDSVSKEAALQHMEDGYCVLRRSFTPQLPESRCFHKGVRYNILCMETEKALHYIDTFLQTKEMLAEKDFRLYVQLEEATAPAVRREILSTCPLRDRIHTFCARELTARMVLQANPVTRYLPKSAIVDGAVKPETQIHMYFLGFGRGNQQLYRQSILNNQLVTYENGTYRVKPVHYHICDVGVDASAWEIGGLPEALQQLQTERYYPLPELPFDTEVADLPATSRVVLQAIEKQVQQPNCHTFVWIDTEADCTNMDIAAKLKTLLHDQKDYHLFVRSETVYAQDDPHMTTFGRSEQILTHDVIVGDSLAILAQQMNLVYTARESGSGEITEAVKQQAQTSWQQMDEFTVRSNIQAAMSLRVKLNLLGLDYAQDGKAEGCGLISRHYPSEASYDYRDHGACSVRNALIAQEHARWNAYHLLREWLPLEKDHVTQKASTDGKIRFQVKQPAVQKHACLTTYAGLYQLSADLAQRAGQGYTAANFDYYQYDELLILCAEQLLQTLGFSIRER